MRGTGNGSTATVTKHRCEPCGQDMIEVEVGSQLSVRKCGDDPQCYWTSSPVDAFTCATCGRTELFARTPHLLS